MKLTLKEAEALLKKYLKHRPDKINHSINVSKVAYDTAVKIKQKHPELDVDPDEVRIFALLHDIGRHTGKWLDHTFNGAKLLRELGHDHYAKRIETHDAAPELAEYFGIEGDYHPSHIEEKILVFADLHDKGGKLMTPEDKFKIIYQRIKEKYRDHQEPLLKSSERRRKIFEEVRSLLK